MLMLGLISCSHSTSKLKGFKYYGGQQNYITNNVFLGLTSNANHNRFIYYVNSLLTLQRYDNFLYYAKF